MKNKYKYFLIAPVRGISDAWLETEQAEVAFHEKNGDKVYWPLRDTNQDALEISICKENYEAMRQSENVLVMWDGHSQGCLFDLGMAYAMGKKILAVTGRTPRMTSGKSFANLIFALQEE